jgi:hypothetical protein
MVLWGAMASMNSAVVSVTFHVLRFIGHLPFVGFWASLRLPFPEGKSIADGFVEPLPRPYRLGFSSSGTA